MKMHNTNGPVDLTVNAQVNSGDPSTMSNGKLTREVLKAIGRAGYDPTDVPEALDNTLAKFRLDFATRVLLERGFTKPELNVLLPADRDGLLESQFNRAIDRAKSGVRLLPGVLAALSEQNLVAVIGSSNSFFQTAFENAPAVTEETALDHIQKGGVFVESDEVNYNRFLAKCQEEVRDRVTLATWSVEKIVLEAVRESAPTIHSVAALLSGGEVVGDEAIGKYAYGEARFNAKKRLINNDKTLLSRVACLRSVINTNEVMTLQALALQGVRRGSTAKAILTAAPSIFEEVHTGYVVFMPDQRHTYVERNKVGFLKLNCRKYRNNMPVVRISDNRTTDEVAWAGDFFSELGFPVLFSSQLEWVSVGDGATAGLIEIDDEGNILLGTDAGKKTKRLNRQKLGYTYTVNVVDCAGQSLIVASGLRVRLRDGSYTRAYGVPIKVWMTNYTLTPGSGVGYVRRGCAWMVSMEKTYSVQINAINLGEIMAELDEETGKPVSRDKAMISAVKNGEWINRELLEFGDPIFKYNGHTFKVFTGKGMTAKVIGEPTYSISARAESVEIKLKLQVMYACSAHKFKSDGIKSTGLEVDYLAFDMDGNTLELPELLLTGEEIKGMGLALLRMWADSDPLGVDFDLRTGLTEDQKHRFEEWRKKHTKKVAIEVEVDDEHYQMLKEMCERAKADSKYRKAMKMDPDAYEFLADNKIRQTSTVVEGTVAMAIEASTVRENMTSQPMIGEQIMILETICPDVVQHLWGKSRPQHLAVYKMLDMALSKVTDDMSTQEAVPVLTHPLNLKGRDLLDYYKKLHPNGLALFVDGDTYVVIHFDALLALGAIQPSGAASGVALSVITLLDHLHHTNAGVSAENSMTGRLVDMARTAAENWADANGVLARVAKTSNALDGRKVKLTIGREIGYGEVGLNPNDPVVKSLLNKKGFVVEGDLAIVSRSPMGSVFAGRVKLTDKCPIGTILVKASLWAYGNEGDGDGDPASELFLGANGQFKDQIEKILETIESSPFGPQGYFMAHGEDWLSTTYAEFYGGNADPSKDPATALHQVYKVKRSDFIKTAVQTGRHYEVFLGKTFAMTSYLTYLLGKKNECGDVIDDAHIRACVIAWRALYEGLGLAGCTDKAVEFHQALGTLGNTDRIKIGAADAAALASSYDVVTVGEGEDLSYYLVGIEAMKYSAQIALEMELTLDEAFYLRAANLTTHLYSLLENNLDGENDPLDVVAKKPHLAEYLELALAYGTLRRGSKGLAVGRSFQKEENNGLFRYVTRETEEAFGNGIIREILGSIIDVQHKVCELRTDIIEKRS